MHLLSYCEEWGNTVFTKLISRPPGTPPPAGCSNSATQQLCPCIALTLHSSGLGSEICSPLLGILQGLATGMGIQGLLKELKHAMTPVHVRNVTSIMTVAIGEASMQLCSREPPVTLLDSSQMETPG